MIDEELALTIKNEKWQEENKVSRKDALSPLRCSAPMALFVLSPLSTLAPFLMQPIPFSSRSVPLVAALGKKTYGEVSGVY